MNRIDKAPSKNRSCALRRGLLILPAIACGVLAMVCSGVSPSLWGQQLVAWAVLLLLTHCLSRAAARIPAGAWLLIFTAVLAATLLGEGANGARRWLHLGFFNVNAAMLVLPGLLSVLYRSKSPHPFLLAAALVMSFQPDLSQLTALCTASLPLLWQHREKRFWSMASLAGLCLLVIRCMGAAVVLDPVPYTEGILTLLRDILLPLKALGYALLAIIPACFLWESRKQRQPRLLGLAVYYAVTLLFAFSGSYPVPFMGFGLSPIAGCFLTCLCTPESSLA